METCMNSSVKLTIVLTFSVLMFCISAAVTDEPGSDYEAAEVDPPGSTPRPGINVETAPEPGDEFIFSETEPPPRASETEPPGSTPRPGINVETMPEPGLEHDTTKPRPGETLPEEPSTGSGAGF